MATIKHFGGIIKLQRENETISIEIPAWLKGEIQKAEYVDTLIDTYNVDYDEAVEICEAIESHYDEPFFFAGDYNAEYNAKTQTLTWEWQGVDYSCTGEFYIDSIGILHHTFTTPLGVDHEIELKVRY